VSTTWDPGQYAKFADQRSRPFDDLLARVGARAPELVVDLGCGNGPLTLGLARRWPQARVVGVDHSSEMLEAARSLDPEGRVEWVEADVATWDPSSLGSAPDVVVTNATLQWVPGHEELLARWARALAPGGWLAMQVPGNLDAPSHALMREVAAGHPARDRLRAPLARLAVLEPAAYVQLLGAEGLDVDGWETTYQHVLDPQGRQANPVLEWVRGTGLRPVLDALTGEGEQDAFLAEYDARLRAAYPRTPIGVVFGFRRIFCVGHKPGHEPGHEPGERREGAQVVGLHHVQVAVPAGSEDALRTFYGGVVGLPEIPKPPVLATRGGVWFRVGPQELHCGVEAGFRPAAEAHPAFAVDDVEAMAAAVEATGAKVTWDEAIPGVRRFHTTDPVGNRVEFQQA
jgi:trans-aconitate 2-methyltransferase